MPKNHLDSRIFESARHVVAYNSAFLHNIELKIVENIKFDSTYRINLV